MLKNKSLKASHFTDRENEARRETVTSLRSPTQAVAVLWLKSDRSPNFQAKARVRGTWAQNVGEQFSAETQTIHCCLG